MSRRPEGRYDYVRKTISTNTDGINCEHAHVTDIITKY